VITYTFNYNVKNSHGTAAASAGTVTLIFPQGSGLKVNIVDGMTKAPLSPNDYRWIIEEDRTFYVDPNCTTNQNPQPAGCNQLGSATSVPPTFGVNFHTSYMPVVATGCVGDISCGGGQTIAGNPAPEQFSVDPGQVALDPTKRYYISVIPGDAAYPFETGNATSGHTMGGAEIGLNYNGGSVQVLAEPTPLQPSKLAVFVFEDDFPLNGEQDASG